MNIKNKPNFSNYLKYETMQDLADFCLSRSINWTDKDRTSYREHITKINKCVYDYLKDIHNYAHLEEIENSQGHIHPFVNGWNKLVDRIELQEQEIEDLCTPITESIVVKHFSVIEPEEDIKKRYQIAINNMEKGNIASYDLKLSNNCCEGCEQFISIGFKDWQGFAGKFTNKGFVALENCFEEKIETIEVEFKTGNLLISDWFRIKEFTELTKTVDSSLSSSKGRVEYTKNLLEKVGIISVSMLDCGSYIFAKDGEIIAGDYVDYEDETSGEYNVAGSVTQDFWGTTIVEKEKLEEIIAQKVGKERAKDMVENYIEDNDVLSVAIEPGKYNLYFSGNSNEFSSLVGKELPILLEDCTNLAPSFIIRKPVIEYNQRLTKKNKM